MFRPFIFNAIIDRAGFTFVTLLFVFHWSLAFFPSGLSLNDWVCSLIPLLLFHITHCFMSSKALSTAKRLQCSQLVLSWQNLHQLQRVVVFWWDDVIISSTDHYQKSGLQFTFSGFNFVVVVEAAAVFFLLKQSFYLMYLIHWTTDNHQVTDFNFLNLGRWPYWQGNLN